MASSDFTVWLQLGLGGGGGEGDVSTTDTPGPLSPDPTAVKAVEAPNPPSFVAEFFMVCKVPEVTGLT